MKETIQERIRLLKKYSIYHKFCAYFKGNNYPINNYATIKHVVIFFFQVKNIHDSRCMYKDYLFESYTKDYSFWESVHKELGKSYWNGNIHLNEFEDALIDLVIIYDMI